MKPMLPWRPISDCPANLRRALVFDPSNVFWLNGSDPVADERVAMADQHDDGAWYVDSYQGGYSIKPTHFLEISVPDGFPETVDPAPLREEAEAKRAAQEALQRQHEIDRANAQREATENQDPGRQRELQASYERYWADPENLRRALSGED